MKLNINSNTKSLALRAIGGAAFFALLELFQTDKNFAVAMTVGAITMPLIGALMNRQPIVIAIPQELKVSNMPDNTKFTHAVGREVKAPVEHDHDNADHSGERSTAPSERCKICSMYYWKGRPMCSCEGKG